MINMQLRMYKEDLSYSHTSTVDLYPEQIPGLLELFFGPHMRAPGYKKVWPTNIMFREKGKLVSYKKFGK